MSDAAVTQPAEGEWTCIVCDAMSRPTVEAFLLGLLVGVNVTEHTDLALSMYAHACAEHQRELPACIGRQMAQEMTKQMAAERPEG